MLDKKENYGILTSISWSSSKWILSETINDVKKSNYGYTKQGYEGKQLHESLNFGHETYPSEEDGYYIGYTPSFSSKVPSAKNSKHVDIMFFRSTNYNDNQQYIVGFYGYPEIQRHFSRNINLKKYPDLEGYELGNIKSKIENIIYFEKPIPINNDIITEKKLLPDGKKIAQQGFNYLDYDSVHNLLKVAVDINPNDEKLKKFVENFE